VKPINRAGVAAIVLALGSSAAAAGQGPPLTLQQVEQKYSRMNEAHIKKCDKNGDDLFDRGEMACVSSLYSALYLSN
jgi:hypothetical protein